VTLKYLRKMEGIDVAQLHVPSVIQHGKVLIRGSEEWDAREQARRATGCSCLSFGPVPKVGGKVLW
jgi:hypothetical protein